MNTDFRFLQLLDEDLREAAAREASGVAPLVDPARRRLLRRGRRWTTLVAASVILLVVAGGIGFVTQNRSAQRRASIDATSGTGIAGPSATAVPNGLQAPRPPSAGQVATGQGPSADTAAHGDSSGLPAATSGNEKATGGALGSAAVPGLAQTDLSKIVRDGSIGLEVGNGTFGRAVARLTAIAVANRGMVLSSATQNETSGVFTLRIPASRFDRAMLALRGIAKATDGRVLADARTGRDVTAQFIDLRARLALLRQRRALLVSLQDNATTVGGILAIANKVDKVQLQIEQIQGQLNVLNDQVTESTIKANIREQDAVDHVMTPPPDSRLRSSWRLATDGFLNVVGAVVVGLGYLVPIGILALAGFAVFTLVRRRRHGAS
jgi:Domain of unknown function (DUF4349)